MVSVQLIVHCDLAEADDCVWPSAVLKLGRAAVGGRVQQRCGPSAPDTTCLLCSRPVPFPQQDLPARGFVFGFQIQAGFGVCSSRLCGGVVLLGPFD